MCSPRQPFLTCPWHRGRISVPAARQSRRQAARQLRQGLRLAKQKALKGKARGFVAVSSPLPTDSASLQGGLQFVYPAALCIHVCVGVERARTPVPLDPPANTGCGRDHVITPDHVRASGRVTPSRTLFRPFSRWPLGPQLRSSEPSGV